MQNVMNMGIFISVVLNRLKLTGTAIEAATVLISSTSSSVTLSLPESFYRKQEKC